MDESCLAAQGIRDIAVAILDVMGAERGLAEEHDADPAMTTELWYERHCVSISQAVKTAADACGLPAALVFGVFVGPKVDGRYPRPVNHAWLELEDRTIIDPTSLQMDVGPECAIIEPWNEIHRHYRPGWWDGH